MKDKYGIKLNELELCKTIVNMTQTDCSVGKEGYIVVHNPAA